MENLKMTTLFANLFWTFVILISFNAHSRTTFEQIVHNKPNIVRSYAKRLAEEIDSAADRYKVPANVLAAIAMQESSYILNAVNKRSNDYGLMQINMYNIRAYKFDKQKLLTDLAYSIEAGAIVFQWFYKRYGKLDHAIQAYNGGTAKGVTKWKSTKDYLRKVKRYM